MTKKHFFSLLVASFFVGLSGCGSQGSLVMPSSPEGVAWYKHQEQKRVTNSTPLPSNMSRQRNISTIVSSVPAGIDISTGEPVLW